jgi:hypothetical protein
MPTLLEVGTARMSPTWRASCVILCAHFARDRAVWDAVVPGESIDLGPLVYDQDRPVAQRVLLAVAQSFHDPAMLLPFGHLATLPDRQLRTVLDALAIARGSLPID